jgi:multiple sugar transport system substrate-binding protein
MSENKHITMEYGSVPYEDAPVKFTQMGAAGDLPDTINFYGSLVSSFVDSKWILPLDGYIDREGYREIFMSAIIDTDWKNQINAYGAVYTIPDGIMTNGIFIRKDWVEEAGLDLQELRSDWTWETYIDTVYKLTDPEKGRYGISYRGSGPGAFDRLQQYIIAYTDSYDFDDEGNCLYYTPENVERIQKFLNMYIDGCGPKDSINWGFAEMVDNFTGGLTATLNNDVEVVAICMERMEDSEWAVMPLPKSSVNGRINSYMGAAYLYAVSAQTKYPDEAWGFIEVMCRADNNADFCKRFTNMPIRKDIEDEFFGENGPVAGFVKQLDDPKFCIHPGYGGVLDLAEWRSEVYVTWQKVLMGDMTCDAALKQVDEDLTKIAKQWIADNPGKSMNKATIGGKEVPYSGPSGVH